MKFNKIFSSLESQNMKYSLVLIVIWILLRIFLEGVFEEPHRIGYASLSYPALLMYFLHFPLFYLSAFLFITIIISLLIGEDIRTTTRINTLGLGLIILVPLIDALRYGGCYITYPLRLERYFLHFLNPFVTLIDIGISEGQRIVVVLICFLSGIYGYLRTKKIFRAIIIILTVFGAILFWGGLPTILAQNHPETVYQNGGILNSDTQKFCGIYLILFIVLFGVYNYFLDRRNFSLLLASIRWERMAFYGLVALMGFFLANRVEQIYQAEVPLNILGLFLIFLGPALGFWTLQILNDFYDQNIDSISQRDNPLLLGITKGYYRNAGIILSLITIAIALILSYPAFLIMKVFLILGVVYSLPPLRLKRFPFISTFVLALAVLFMFAFGWSIVYQDMAFQKIPKNFIYALLIGVTIGFSAKDINGIAGDRQNGIITLPILLYKDASLWDRLPYSLLLSFSFVPFAFFMPGTWVGTVIASMLTFFYSLLKKRPKEIAYWAILYGFSLYLFLHWWFTKGLLIPGNDCF
ncbi:MAG: UbiA family prenyltransferase [candidate division WOR-3 bacterium]